MNLLKWVLILILTGSYCLYGQDTISVFFESCKSKIPEIQFSILNAIPAQFDLSALDSVSYTGIADSVGNVQANLKLSKKRAIEIKKYCSVIFPRNYLYKITALGEKQGNDITLNRRVDIVLYFKPDKTEEVNEPVPPFLAANRCYYVDYALLHRAHTRVITKKKMQYVMLVIPFVKKTDKHYYGTITKNGELRPMRIKWAGKQNRPLVVGNVQLRSCYTQKRI